MPTKSEKPWHNYKPAVTCETTENGWHATVCKYFSHDTFIEIELYAPSQTMLIELLKIFKPYGSTR